MNTSERTVTGGVLATDIDPVKPFDRLLLEFERRGLLEPINALCKEGGVLIEEVLGDDRHVPVVRTRHRIWFYLYDERRYSYPLIGMIWGRVDHTTVRHGVRTAARELGIDDYRGRSPGAWRAQRRAAEADSSKCASSAHFAGHGTCAH